MPGWRARAAFWLHYPTLYYNQALCAVLPWRHWWDWIAPDVLLGALPFASSVQALSDLEIRGVVNTCAEYAGPLDAYARAGIEQLHIPTVDFTPPTLEDCQRAVAFIEAQHAEGRKVYLHCKAGRARSATVALCWLIATRGLTPEQAQAHLLRYRPHVKRGLERRAVVRAFYQAQFTQRP
jgi:atypical dual specificity phosphatase